MKVKDLQDFAKKELNRQLDHYGVRGDPKINYTMFAKLVEEVGELSEAMLMTEGLQRGDKLRNAKSELADEFADVILSAFILAEKWGVDAGEAVERKIEKIGKRDYK